ncbi:hypothetical protein MGU_11647 [Metarhizium guizhouense ARSEF 977]|uniref:Uncharacterized protein n=1 Tax=Metarhizium guizhouense (strain ARSEF 977) TaxID=1276136 RepID=A0A0B4GES2_METGA|nr:hypothetical protein MGU_11647 [Metarhizium guizhouense ARSEF 977]
MELQDSAISKPLTGWRKRLADVSEKLRGEPHPDPVPTFGASLIDAPSTPLLEETQPNKTFLAEIDRALRQVQSIQRYRNNICGKIAPTEHRLHHQKRPAIVHVYEDESSESEAEEMTSALSPYITRLYHQTFVANQHASSQSKRRRETGLDYTPQKCHFHGNDLLGFKAKNGHQLVGSRSRRALKPLSHVERAVDRATATQMADGTEVGKPQKRRRIV